MKRKQVVSFMVLVAVLLAVTTAHAQAWTDVMNWPTNCTNAECGNFFPIGGGVSYQYQTHLGAITPANTLNLSGVTTPIPSQKNFTWNCGGTSSSTGTNLWSTPLTFVETYSGSGVKGVGFLGTFANTNTFALTVNGNLTNLIESVFFNENQCYGTNSVGGGDGPNANGREYGFALYSYTNGIFAYWGTDENQGSSTAQVNFPVDSSTNQQSGGSTPVAGHEYYYEIWPTVDGTSCDFNIEIFDKNNTVTPIYKAFNIPVNGNSASAPYSTSLPITGSGGADSMFCSVITSSSGDIGFVSANIVPPPGGSGTLPSTSDLYVYLERLFVLK